MCVLGGDSLLVLLLVSGIIMWRPYFAPVFSIPVIRIAIMVHSFAAVALIVVIMVHIYAALWVKGTITAMMEGWVTKTWAKKHHPRWYREVRQKEENDGMSIRIIPQDELEKSEKRTAEVIPPLLFPRLKNLYNRRAERLRALAEHNPLGDYLRFAALIAHARRWCCTTIRWKSI